MHPSDLNRKPGLEELLARVPERWRSALMDEPTDLASDLAKIACLRASAGAAPVESYRREGWSTYSLSLHTGEGLAPIGMVQFAPLFVDGFLIRKTLLATKQVITLTEHYDDRGNYLGRFHEPAANLLYVELTDMEPQCPILSHVYNILRYDYQQAKAGSVNAERIRILERTLHSVEDSEIFRLSHRVQAHAGLDEALVRMNEKILRNETDPVLTYTDKQAIRKNLKAERAGIVAVKSRVHGVWPLPIQVRLFFGDLAVRLRGWKALPVEKALGFLNKYTVGVALWFVSIVKNNIGYSLALAIYAPFTYFFITQPMNPKAVWAVGELRKGYLSAVDWAGALPVFRFFSNGEEGPSSAKTEAPSPGADARDGEPASSGHGDAPASAAETPNGASSRYSSWDPRTDHDGVKPRFEGFPVETDAPDVEKQDWATRMNVMKQFQIQYESNLQMKERMGRLEQMETQLNFALIAEHAYRELEAYQRDVARARALLQKEGKLAPDAATYLDGEDRRSRQQKLYIWDKIVRYMLDHPYIVMNEDGEQKYVDFYIGRSFVFLQEITLDLQKRYEGFRKPKGYKAIEELAKFYRGKYQDGPTVEDRLAKNSVLAKQKNFWDGRELREKMKRQWEILFLYYNRAQEPSNFALQAYVWSVRNAIWVFGSMATTKSREMEMVESALRDPATKAAFLADQHGKIEPFYESLFHILSLEYVSMREEIRAMDNDVEATQRQLLIDATSASFKERTAFLKAIGLSPSK